MPSSPEPWLVTATRLSRMVRPFPLRRLADALYFVEADSASIRERLQAMLIDPPRLADDWCAELYALAASLKSLSTRCGEALPVLAELVDQADSDEQRALDALLKVWETIPAEPLQAAA